MSCDDQGVLAGIEQLDIAHIAAKEFHRSDKHFVQASVQIARLPKTSACRVKAPQGSGILCRARLAIAELGLTHATGLHGFGKVDLGSVQEGFDVDCVLHIRKCTQPLDDITLHVSDCYTAGLECAVRTVLDAP